MKPEKLWPLPQVEWSIHSAKMTFLKPGPYLFEYRLGAGIAASWTVHLYQRR